MPFYDEIDDLSFPIIAAKAYSTSCYDIIEFKEDLNRIRSLKKLFNKYKQTKELKTLLILNHLIVFYNVFQPDECATKMLVLKLSMHLETLKPFLIYLNKWPKKAITGLGIRKETIWESDIPLDLFAVQALKNLRK